MPAREDRLAAGQPIPAKVLNLIPEGAERLLRTDAGGGLTWSDLGIGPILADTTPEKIPVRLSGSGPAYDWAEVYPNPDGTWSTLTGGRSGTGNAYEANSKTGLGSNIVHIAYQPSGDYRFYLPRFGSTCRTTIQVTNCGFVVSGATVVVVQSGTTVASGTTATSGSVLLNIPAAGSYQVTASISGLTRTATLTLTCNGTTTIDLRNTQRQAQLSVFGCATNSVVPGVSVVINIHGTSTQIAAGTTDANGHFLYFADGGSSVDVFATSPYATNVPANFPQFVPIAFCNTGTDPIAGGSVRLIAATGYQCFGNISEIGSGGVVLACIQAAPNLTLTDSALGTFTLIRSNDPASPPSNPGWANVTTPAIPRPAYTLDGGGILNASPPQGSGFGGAPNAGATCPPALLLTYTVPPTHVPGDSYESGATITITE